MRREVYGDRKVAAAFLRWSRNIPTEKKPFGINGVQYSAHELAQEVRMRTPLGQLQLEIMDHFIKTHPKIGTEGYIEMIEPDYQERKQRYFGKKRNSTQT